MLRLQVVLQQQKTNKAGFVLPLAEARDLYALVVLGVPASLVQCT